MSASPDLYRSLHFLLILRNNPQIKILIPKLRKWNPKIEPSPKGKDSRLQSWVNKRTCWHHLWTKTRTLKRWASSANLRNYPICTTIWARTTTSILAPSTISRRTKAWSSSCSLIWMCPMCHRTSWASSVSLGSTSPPRTQQEKRKEIWDWMNWPQAKGIRTSWNRAPSSKPPITTPKLISPAIWASRTWTAISSFLVAQLISTKKVSIPS